MSEPIKRCSRCDEPIEEVAARVAIESGPLHASHPVLHLCTGCSESLERWLARRHRGRSSRGSSRAHSHRHGEDDSPARFSGEADTGLVSPRSEGARQIIVTLVVLAIFAVSVSFFVSFMR